MFHSGVLWRARTVMANYEIRDLESLTDSTRATVTRAEVARLPDVDVRTVGRAIADGQLPVLRISRRLLFPRVPLAEMLTSGYARMVF